MTNFNNFFEVNNVTITKKKKKKRLVTYPKQYILYLAGIKQRAKTNYYSCFHIKIMTLLMTVLNSRENK